VVNDLWDGVSLKCTSRRTFDTSVMALWEEVTDMGVLGCKSAFPAAAQIE
jgi:hypothetical protein